MMNFSKPDVEAFFRTLNILDFDVNSTEDELVFSTNLNGYYNLWAMKLDRRYPYQLSTINQVTEFVKYHPNGTTILTGFDHDGDENYHIYALPVSGGKTVPLLQAEDEKFFFGALSKQGDTLYYTTSQKNPNFLNIEKIDLETGSREALVRGEAGPHNFMALSPDGASFVFNKDIGNTSSFAYLFQKGKETLLAPPQDQPHRVSKAVFIDSDNLLLLTNYESEFTYLASYQVSSETFTQIASVEGHEFTDFSLEKENSIAYLVGERGVEDRLYRVDLSTNELTVLETPFDKVSKIKGAAKGTLFALGQSAIMPNNLFRYQSEKGSWERLTDHRVMGVDPSDLTEPEVLNYPSYDGKEIEALYFVPKAEVDNGYTVLCPHGGPQHAETKTFRALFQYLCSQGYRVFTPNFRGSTGYGESFMNLVNKDWGGAPRQDIIAGMEWLDTLGKSDPEKWFCYGGSYGGYMTLLLHARHADRFIAFVDLFGPSNLFTTIETAPEHWKAADRELIGDPEVDREKLIEDSPMTYIDQMTKPMLVVQGVNDPRVVKEESDVIVEALRARGQDVEYLLLEDEGHGFSKTENAIKVYRTVVDFLNKHI